MECYADGPHGSFYARNPFRQEFPWQFGADHGAGEHRFADAPNLATPIAAEAVVLKKLQVKWCQKSETVRRSILIHFGRSWRWESDLCGKRVSAWKRELLPALLVV